MSSKEKLSVVVEVNAVYQGRTQIGSEIFSAWKYDVLVQNHCPNRVQL